MVCNRLIKTGSLFFTKTVFRNNMMGIPLKYPEITTKVNLVHWKHFSLATIDLCEHSNPKKIKKKPAVTGNFQNQFFLYLRNNGSYHCCTPTILENENCDLLQKPIKQLTDDELPVYVASIINARKLTESLRKEIDEECVSRLSRLTTDNLLKLVDAWLYYMPHILNTLKFYRSAMHKFHHVLASEDISQPAFIQTYFYVGLCLDKALAKKIIKTGLDKVQTSHSLIEKLSLEKLAIISLSSFRTSNTISSRLLLQAIADCIKSNLEFLLKHDAFFVTLVKPLRPAEFYDLKLLDAIAANLSLFESKNIVTKIQIFSLFSQSLYYDKEFLHKLANIIGSDLLYLLENKETMGIRIKDVSRFLWGLSYLGVIPNVKNLDEEVMEKIDDWIDGKYFDNSNLDQLVTMMCSIYMINWHYEKLFRKIFSTFPVHCLNIPNFSKNLRNLNLLVTGLNIEAPHLVSDEMLEVLRPTGAVLAKQHLLTRPILKDAYKTAWLLKSRLNLRDILCHFNIPHLLILGLSFYTPKGNLLHIEVLDRSNCLLTSNIPIGLMNLKLRLHKHLKRHVLIIDSTKLGKQNNFIMTFENKIQEIDAADKGLKKFDWKIYR